MGIGNIEHPVASEGFLNLAYRKMLISTHLHESLPKPTFQTDFIEYQLHGELKEFTKLIIEDLQKSFYLHVTISNIY